MRDHILPRLVPSTQELTSLCYSERREQERRHGLTSAILDALSPPSVGADREQTVIVGTRIAENATHTLAADVLAHSTSLIRNYARLDDLVAEFGSERAESVANTWKENIRQTEEQLRLGARVALKNTKKVLGAVTGGMSGMEDEGDEGDVEMLSGEAKELNYDLQMSLQYAERGVKRMAKAVPFERS